MYLQANLDLIDGTRRPHNCVGVHSGAHVDSTASVTHSVVADGVTVGAGSSITDSVLLPGAVVDDHATVANSVVMGKIGAGASVTRSVLGLHGRVAPGESASDELRPAIDPT